MPNNYFLRSGKPQEPVEDENCDVTMEEMQQQQQQVQQATPDQLATLIETLRSLKSSIDEMRIRTEGQQRDMDNLRQEIMTHRTPTPSEENNPPTSITSEVTVMERAPIKLYDLPTFSGNAEDWPLFYANFKDSTEVFRYNNRQNLMRLHKCLAGAAKDAVASMLIHPEGVPQAMEELEFRFGRSDQLIRCQLSKLQNFPAISENKLEQMIAFSTNVRNVVAFIKSAKCEQHLNNPLLLEQVVSKLPASKQYEWACKATTIKPYPTINDFAIWLTELARVISTMSATSTSITKANPQPPRRVMHVNDSIEKPLDCYCCHKGHAIATCQRFHQSLSVKERWELVKKEKLCFACLRKGHNVLSCRSKKQCGVSQCKRFHHASLHEVRVEQTTPSESAQPILNCSTPNLNASYLFKVLPVNVYGPNGKLEIFAMVDEGATISMMDEGVANKLGLKGQAHTLTLQWYDEKVKTEQSRKVNVEIENRSDRERFTMKNVHSVRQLNLPIQSFKRSDFSYLDSLPIEEYVNVQPTLLLGLDHAHLTATIATVQARRDSPLAVKTKLGWIAYGPTRFSNVPLSVVLHVHEINPSEELHQVVAEYFATDTFGTGPVQMSIESEDVKRARNIMQTTTRYDGKFYETGLLWSRDKIYLPDSYEAAVKRLYGIERKMKDEPEFARKYRQEMEKYFENGYAKILSAEEVSDSSQPKWYLPHFAVQSPYKPNKLRIVFDAAAKVQNTSLNSCLLKGPEQAKSLQNILFRFRQGVIGVAADIKEMFSRIKIRKEDQNAQRFLWRSDSGSAIQECCMTSMIFGSACSPCCAEFIKNHNAFRFEKQYPEAVNAIVERHYVDDFVCSYNDPELAIRNCREVVAIHAEAGFELRNFISNSSQVQHAMKSAAKYDNVSMEKQTMSEKVLGMFWNVRNDTFEFHTQFHRVPPEVLAMTRAPTKREFLGIIMSVFDPFGLLAAVTAASKIIMQEVWRSNIGWDDEITDEVNEKWVAWWRGFHKFDQFKVPRPYSSAMASARDVQLHMFVDASQMLFAAVGYFRIATEGEFNIAFVAAKTRNAPLKLMSVPRLELQAAVLGTRLSQMICNNHDIIISNVIFWTDSKTVWHWIHSTNRQYKAFVGHRIAEIVSATNPSQWRWIPTEHNVADDATRPKPPAKFNCDGRWLRGPDFLREEETAWPTFDTGSPPDMSSEEVQPQLLVQKPPSRLIDYNKFSSYTKVKNTVAWVLRFKSNLLRSRNIEQMQTPMGVSLTATEIDTAEKLICRWVQQECFAREIEKLKSSQPVRKDSPLYSLSPYMEEDGLIRVRGRIDEATYLPFSARRPILLPQLHAISFLIMQYFHKKNHHQNRAIIINESRQMFWVIHVRAVLKAVEKSCAQCQLDRAKPVPPLMGPLPEDRVTPYVRPFTYTGVDLFGPLTVAIGPRHEKRWGVIFTCLTVRAVHIELAADLSTDAFLICLRNFINRRGTPVRIRSDNGTNFLGAQKKLKQCEHLLDVQQIEGEAVKRGVEWVFNCPANPSSGGCWERLIRIVKRLLLKILHEVTPRVETLQSVLIEAENIINSRPLTDIPLTTLEDEPLTPNHFLVGCVNSTQTPQPVDEKICLRKQWRIAQNLKDRLWKRWTVEFLPQLLHRQKWHETTKCLKVDDVVIICDPTLPRGRWQKGIVVKVYPNKDGQVRFVDVKTATGVLRRPTSKLAVLEVRES